MIKIHFVSGKVKELDQPWDKFPQKLNFGGLRLLKGNNNLLIPLNSNTIEYVEYDPTEEEIIRDKKHEARRLAEEGEAPVEVEPETPEEAQERVAAKTETNDKETDQQRNDRLMAQMMEKSDCHKNGHEGRDMEIFYQETTVGKKKADGTMTHAKRYFPVCTFCGVRERYVKAIDLTDEQKENAKIWDK